MNFLDEFVGEGGFYITDSGKEYAKKGYYTVEESISVITSPDAVEKGEKVKVMMIMFWILPRPRPK